jgi:hypothetical protein
MHNTWSETQARPLSDARLEKRLGVAPMTVAQAAFLMLHLLTWLAAVAQFFIDGHYDNLLAVALVVCSSSASFLYVQRTRALADVPLSAMAVIGLCMTTQWGALVGQSLSGDSLTASLRVPLQTFGYLIGFQFVTLSAHWLSRRFTSFAATRSGIAEKLVRPLGVFRIPSVHTVWFIGCLGLLAILGGRAGQGTLSGKIADGVAVFAWAPFALPLLHARFGEAYCRFRLHLPLMIGFGGLATALALAFNGRSLMLVGVVTAALLMLFSLLSDEQPFKWKRLRTLALVTLLTVLIFQPLDYVVMAMQVARAERAQLSGVEMIEHTFRVANDPVAVQRERDAGVTASVTAAYDENYFSHPMIGRLVVTKHHDNGFFMVEGISAVESRMVAEDARDRILSILPYPVLLWMDLGRAKWVTFYSAGDVLTDIRLGDGTGYFRAGSMLAQLIAIFGVWTPFLYALICIPVFIFWDLLSEPGAAGRPARMSLVGMLLIYHVFSTGIVSDSISTQFGILLRFQLQNVLLYALIFGLTRRVWQPFDPISAPGSAPADGRPVPSAAAA